MKKIFTLAAIAAVTLSFSLTSCSKAEEAAEKAPETAQEYKTALDNLEKEYSSAVEAGDEAKAKEIQEKAEALVNEIMEKSQNDPDFAKQCLGLE